MFCNEPVKKVYMLYTDEGYCAGDYYLDFYHSLTYHVGVGCGIVLETEHYAVFVDAFGVHKYNAPATPRSENEWLVSCIFTELGEADWTEAEQTLFEGECISEVRQDGENFIVSFTNFELKILPYDSETVNNMLRNGNFSYVPVLGCNRWLKKRCICGGEDEIFKDFVDDFIVRCKMCKKSTRAGMNLIDAINDWNNGELHCDLSDIIIE